MRAPKPGKVEARERAEIRALAGAFPFTDLGNAERLVVRNRDRIRFCLQRRKWLLWDGTRLAWDERDEIFQLAKQTVRAIHKEAGACRDDQLRLATAKHARDSEKLARIQALVSLARTEAGVSVLLAELDADSYALNCSNGTLDLRTGKMRKANPADLITKTTGVSFVPGARSALWDRVLFDAVGGDTELAGYLQRVAGYALIGAPLERAFFFLFGPPGTAKSTFIDALHAAFGEYARAASFETWLVQQSMGGNRGDLVRLAGTRLVTSVEVRQGARFDEATLKAVTGGDQLVVAAKYEKEVSFRASFTILLAANDAPIAKDDDEGLWARLRRIPLKSQIPPDRQDPKIKNQLREPGHAAAVLAWAVSGCAAYQRDGLGSCAAVAESTAEYRADLDHFAEFLADRLVSDATGRIDRKSLREAYCAWGEETGRRALLGAKEIVKRLRLRGYKETRLHGNWIWVGLRTRQYYDEEGVRGADQTGISTMSSDDLPQAGLSGNGAPKCTPPAPDDDPEERAAIREEPSAGAAPIGLPLGSTPGARPSDLEPTTPAKEP